MDILSDSLAQELKRRAHDPASRCDTSALHANSVSSDDVLSGLRSRVASHDAETQRGVRDYIEGVNSPLAGLMTNALFGDGSGPKALEGMLAQLMGGKPTFAMAGGQTIRHGGNDAPSPAPPPASEAEIAATERELGFALPGALGQFYREIANGGVGPGDGLYSLAELLRKWRKMTGAPAGPQAQDWPANLLPIQGEDYELLSIDRDTGRLVFWDMEELDDDEDLPPDNPTWAASFKPEAASIEAWLGAWVAAG